MKINPLNWKQINRKVHIYLGLFLLLFIWFFSISGLFLNNPSWFHGQPRRSESSAIVTVPDRLNDQALAEAVMEQLPEVSGEILLARQPAQPGYFRFRVLKASRLYAIQVDLSSGNTTIQLAERSAGGAMEILHTMTGVRRIYGEEAPVRDWYLTRIWSFSMDAASAGLVVLVLTSLHMWWLRRARRLPGMIALVTGSLACAFFVWGLAGF